MTKMTIRNAVLIVLGLRVAYALLAIYLDPQLRQDPLYGDSKSYDAMAWTLASEGRFALGEYKRLQVSPGYIGLMAGVYRLVGHSPQAMRVVNALLGVLTVWGTWLCTRSLFGDKIARWAFWLTALHPQLIQISGWLYTENLVIPLLVWIIYALWQARSLKDYALAGVLSGSLCLTRANFLLFLLFAGIWIMAKGQAERRKAKGGNNEIEGGTGGREENIQHRERSTENEEHDLTPSPPRPLTPSTPNAQRLALLFFCALLVIAPYVIYLYARYERFVPIAGGGYVLFWANNPNADGGFAKIPEQVRLGGEPINVESYTQSSNPVDEDRKYQALGLRWIRENPGAFVRLLFLKTKLALSPMGLQNPKHRKRVSGTLAADVLFLIYLVVAHLGALYGCRKRLRNLSLVFGLWVILWLFIWIYAGGARMLYPAAPFLMIFFVRGISILIAKARGLAPES